MNSKRKNATSAHALAGEWALNRFNESVLARMQNGHDYAQAVADTQAEFSEPEATQQFEREFREAFPAAASVVDEATARTVEGGRVLAPLAARYGLDVSNRHTGAAIASDPLGDRVLDAVADGDLDEAERGMRHVASRIDPATFIEKASDDEIADAIKHGGYDPDQAARERYERMTPEQLDREMEKEFGSSGAKQVAPGVLFSTVQK